VGGRKAPKLSRFVRGDVHLRRELDPLYAAVNCSSEQQSGLELIQEIHFTAADLEGGF
jgi:hypothetical protein